MKPFKVHLRQKPLKDNQASLYLDFGRPVFHAGKNKMTRRDFLGMYLYVNPRSKAERIHNRETSELAEKKRAQTLLEIQAGTYGAAETTETREKKRLATDFLAFYRERMDQRNEKNREAWQNALNHFEKFCEGSCQVKDISKAFLLEFKDYLDRETELSQNTKFLYLNKIKTCISEAHERDLLAKDFGRDVKNFSVKQAQRPFLLDEEIKRLKETSFPASPVLRRMALFSILTSLRWCDVRLLTYEQLQFQKEIGWFVDFESKKTNRPTILYLNEEAFVLCEYSSGRQGRIFPCGYDEKRKIADWFSLAGVRKRSGSNFHIFRHTFGMRGINRGESLSSLAELMGHADTSTTQIYAKILSKTKHAAAHRVTLD